MAGPAPRGGIKVRRFIGRSFRGGSVPHSAAALVADLAARRPGLLHGTAGCPLLGLPHLGTQWPGGESLASIAAAIDEQLGKELSSHPDLSGLTLFTVETD